MVRFKSIILLFCFQLVQEESFSPGFFIFTKMFSLCGVSPKQPAVTTYENILYLQFYSNNVRNDLGFNITYQEVEKIFCEYNITKVPGFFKAPDMDGDGLYDSLMRCFWIILVEQGKVIDLDIAFVRLQENFTDILSVNEYPIEYIYELWYNGMFGRQATIRSRINRISVIFLSDILTNGLGFLIEYDDTEAPNYSLEGSLSGINVSKLTTDYGTSFHLIIPGWISSPGDDLDGFYDYHCFYNWYIVTDIARDSILMKLVYIDIEKTDLCLGDNLVLIINLHYYCFCGLDLKRTVYSIADGVFVSFKTDYTINHVGFNLTFTQVKGKAKDCGGMLNQASGYISSADFDKDGIFHFDQECRWQIHLDYSKVIVFEVLEMQVDQVMSKCQGHFLELHEDHRYIGRYCENNTALTSESNSLYILYRSNFLASGRRFEAVYYQVKDDSYCLPKYKCHRSDKMIEKMELCDHKNDCPFADDERFCQFRCPSGCACVGLLVNCSEIPVCESITESRSFLNQSFVLPSSTRILDLSFNYDMFAWLKLDEQNLPHLTHLNLSYCSLTDLNNRTFLSMGNLTSLDLSNNKLRRLKSEMFISQTKLITLLFNNNSDLLIIEPFAFSGLSMISRLEFNALHIKHLSERSFDSLKLKSLKIYDSKIDYIASESLFNLFAEEIYLNTSKIRSFTQSMFVGAIQVNFLKTDEYKFCCVRPVTVSNENCYPKADELSSCDDLVNENFLRPVMWVIGLFALISNVVAIFYRIWNHKKNAKHCYGFLVCHLAASDFLMGIYMTILAVVDSFYRGIYVFHDEEWRTSKLCVFAGAVAFLSSEVSIFFICFITLDRFLNIKFPLGQKKLSVKTAKRISLVLWLMAVALAIFPLVPNKYFKQAFYNQNSFCLPLPITRAKPSGWEYAVGLFLAFNSFSCLVLAVGQWSIYKEIKTASTKVSRNRTKKSKDARITINLLLVVATNCLCWLPVGLIGSLAMAGVRIPGSVFSWFTIVVLPINAAANPLIYTISEIVQKKRAIKRRKSQSNRSTRTIKTDVVDSFFKSVWGGSTLYWLKQPAKNMIPLQEAMQEQWFGQKERLRVAKKLMRFWYALSRATITLGAFDIESIYVSPPNEGCFKVSCFCPHVRAAKAEDHSEFVAVMGGIISAMLNDGMDQNQDITTEP